jgi:hypothetical protein
MPKQCSECLSMVNDEAPYCDSCGHMFEGEVPVRRWTTEYVVYRNHNTCNSRGDCSTSISLGGALAARVMLGF